MYTFEEFKKEKGRFLPKISVTANGGIGISSAFGKKYNIKDYSGVKLFWDAAQKVVGIKFIKEAEEGMFPLKVREDEAAHLMAKSFFVKYDIKVKELVSRYEPEETEVPGIGRLFVVKLKSKEVGG